MKYYLTIFMYNEMVQTFNYGDSEKDIEALARAFVKKVKMIEKVPLKVDVVEDAIFDMTEGQSYSYGKVNIFTTKEQVDKFVDKCWYDRIWI